MKLEMNAMTYVSGVNKSLTQTTLEGQLFGDY